MNSSCGDGCGDRCGCCGGWSVQSWFINHFGMLVIAMVVVISKISFCCINGDGAYGERGRVRGRVCGFGLEREIV